MTRVRPIVLACVLSLSACGQDAPEEAVPEAPVVVPAEWPAVDELDGLIELRAFGADRVLLLRRVADSAWVRGWAGPAERYRRQSGEIVYAGFWTHASSLRAMLSEDGNPTIAEVEVEPAALRELLGDAGEDIDAALFETQEHEGRWDYVIRETFTGPGVEEGLRCDAELLIRPRTPPTGVLTVEQLQADGPARAPIDAPIQMWLEHGEDEQIPLRRGDVPLERLGTLSETELLRLCSVDCCIETTTEQRAEIHVLVEQGIALAEQMAARPSPDPLRRGSLPRLP